MQRNIYHMLLWGWVSAIALTACSKKDGGAPDTSHLSVMQFIEQDPQLGLLHAAIVRAGADTFFMNSGPYTFFAPTDDAFLQAGLTGNKIATYDPVALNYILSYHILIGRISSKELTGFSRASVASLNKDLKPNVSKNYYGIFFNGMHVDDGNIQLADGVVHKLGGVSFPPVDSMVTVLEKQPELTFFTAALKRSKLLLGLVKPDTLTVFAPHDDAFKAFGYKTIAQINAEDTVVLIRLLNPYIISTARFYLPDLMGNKAVTSNSLTLAANLAPNNRIAFVRYGFTPDGATIIPVSNPALPSTTGILIPPKLLRKNILTRRGIIHTVDQVFIP